MSARHSARAATTGSSNMTDLDLPIDGAGLAALRKPSTDITKPAMNARPIELDSTPIEASTAFRTGSWPSAGLKSNVTSPGADEAAFESVSALKGTDNTQERQNRAQLLDERSRNPAVLVDIPQTPDAVDYEVAQKGVRDPMMKET